MPHGLYFLWQEIFLNGQTATVVVMVVCEFCDCNSCQFFGFGQVVLSGFVLKLFVSMFFVGEFDPGSGRTLAACLTHASRTERPSLLGTRVANG